MEKQITAFVILLMMIVQTYHKAFIVLDYYTNSGYYARLCENKSRPELHCNGKCQMMKELKQDQHKDEQNPGRKISSQNEIISSKSFFCYISKPLIKEEVIAYDIPHDAKAVDMPRSFFHPPGL